MSEIIPNRGDKMNSKRMLVAFLLTSLCVSPPYAQEKKSKKKPQAVSRTQFSPYYHQKASHFEKLPDTAGEIVFLGDSITDGGSWSELLRNPHVINRGISGDITDGVLARLKEVIRSKPAKIFLMIGVNDLAGGRKPQPIVANIRRIVSKIRKQTPQTAVFLQSLLPVNPDLGMFKDHTDKTQSILTINARLRKMAEAFEVTYIDLHASFATEEGKLNPTYTNDGLHLTGAGYEHWKSLIEPLVNEIGR